MKREIGNRPINIIIVLLTIIVIFIGYSLFHQDKGSVKENERVSPLSEKTKDNTEERTITISPPEIKSNTIKDDTALDPRVKGYNEEGLALYNQGRYEEAADLFRKAYENNKDNEILKKNLAYAEGRLGWKEIEAERYEDSLRYFSDSLSMYSKEPDSYIGMGFAYHRLKDNDRAIDAINRGLAIDPKRGEGYKLLAEIYYQMDNDELAISNLETALKIFPDDNNLKGMLLKLTREKKAEAGFQQEATDHFTVRFEGREERDTARAITIILEEAYREVGASFSFYPRDSTAVILYSEEQFKDVTLSPAWTKGIFDGKIRLPIGGALHDQRLLEKVIFHEYTHAVIHNLAGKDVPRWLNEGMAIYMEHGNKDRLGELITKELKRGGKLIPLYELHGTFMNMDESKVSLVYAESYSAVDYLVDRYGIFRVKTLLQELSGNRDFRDAFRDIFFISYDEFQLSWEKSVMNRI